VILGELLVRAASPLERLELRVIYVAPGATFEAWAQFATGDTVAVRIRDGAGYDTIRTAVISKLRLDATADKARVGDLMFMIS